MGQRILADTNCVIDYLDNELPYNAIQFIKNITIELSVINRIELLGWAAAPPEKIKILEAFISSCQVHSLTEEIILRAIEIRKNSRLKLPDAIISATTLIHNLTLFTRNLKNFNRVPALNVTNPHSL